MLIAESQVASAPGLLQLLSDARSRSDALFDLVRSESLYERPIPERHRIIFYVGHLEAFDWNLLTRSLAQHAADSLENGHPGFDRLFAFGIDPVGGGLPTDVPSDWPALTAVQDYVSNVRRLLDDHLADAMRESDPGLQNEASRKESSHDEFPLTTLLNVAVEHRLMHVETLSYMLHQLPLSMKLRQTDSPQPHVQPAIPKLIAVPAGLVTLGLPRNSNSFGWDNEFEAHTREVPAFEIDQYKVTNRQYLEFMAAGGYDTRSYWNDADWDWKTTNNISHPLFWKAAGNTWLWRTMFDEIPLPLDWPVYVSHAEANAYARWAGQSLPTEAEWQRAAYGSPDGEERTYPWGNEAPHANSKRGNFDFHNWDPTPVNAFPGGQSAFGIRDMLGNGWEWTSSVFAPFPGFDPFPFYRGYSADFFDGKHFVIKGGSPRTAACMLRSSFRNWFQAHYQYVYAGFRCVSR
jgi:ergothioneine biosynthesis protein EgtB